MQPLQLSAENRGMLVHRMLPKLLLILPGMLPLPAALSLWKATLCSRTSRAIWLLFACSPWHITPAWPGKAPRQLQRMSTPAPPAAATRWRQMCSSGRCSGRTSVSCGPSAEDPLAGQALLLLVMLVAASCCYCCCSLLLQLLPCCTAITARELAVSPCCRCTWPAGGKHLSRSKC